MSSSQPPSEGLPPPYPSHGSAWPTSREGPAALPSRDGDGDRGRQAGPDVVLRSRTRTAQGLRPAYAGGNGVSGGSGRGRAETAHLVGVCVSVALYLLLTLVSYAPALTAGRTDSGTVILDMVLRSLLLNPFMWIMAGAFVQVIRRRPTALSAAALILESTVVVAELSTGQLYPSAPSLVVLLALVPTAIVSARVNRSLDGRPVSITLAAGACIALIARQVTTFIGVLFHLMELGTLLPVPLGPWGDVASTVRVSLPLAIPLTISLICLAGALVGIVGVLFPRDREARGFLVAGSLIAACALIVLGALPTEVSPLFSSRGTPMPVLAFVLGTTLLLGMSIPAALGAARRWFAQQRRTTIPDGRNRRG